MKSRNLVSKLLIVVMLVGMMVFASISTASAIYVETMSSDSISGGMYDLGTGNTGKVIVQFDISTPELAQDSFIGFCDSSANPKSESEFPLVIKLKEAYQFINGNSYGFEAASLLEAQADPKKAYIRHIMLVVDLNTKKYDAYITPDNIDPVKVADQYSLRPGIAIDDLGKACLYSTDGTAPKKDLFSVKNLIALPYEVPYGQWRGTAWPEQSMHSLGSGNTGVVTTEFDLTILTDGVNGCISYHDTDTLLMAGSWKELPVYINFDTGTNEFVARNYDKTAKDANIPYVKGGKYHVKFVIDTVGQKYDVFIDGVQLAKDAAFRKDSFPMDDVGNIWLMAMSTNSGSLRTANTYYIENHKVNGVLTVPPASPTPAPTATPVPTPVPTATPKPTPVPTVAPDKNPSTSDMSLLPLFTMAAVACTAGATVLRRKK